MGDQDEEWQRKGATLSDKTARAEFGLTQDEIVEAIRAGTLHYRRGSMHGNPWLRLLRREVEDFVKTRYDDRYLKERQATAELATARPAATASVPCPPCSPKGGAEAYEDVVGHSRPDL